MLVKFRTFSQLMKNKKFVRKCVILTGTLIFNFHYFLIVFEKLLPCKTNRCPFNCLFYRINLVSQHQKGKNSMRWQLDHI